MSDSNMGDNKMSSLPQKLTQDTDTSNFLQAL